MSNPRPHEEVEVWCGPVSFPLLCMCNTMTAYLYFDILKHWTFSMQSSVALIYHVPRSGRFLRVQWHFDAKL